MIAADTNVVIRLVVRDDPGQVAQAEGLLAVGLFVSLSVLMECEWVLRGGYRWPRHRVQAALRALLDLEGISAPFGADWVLERHAAGADLADMVHLVATAGLDRFVTFDQRLATGAGAAPPLPVMTL